MGDKTYNKFKGEDSLKIDGQLFMEDFENYKESHQFRKIELCEILGVSESWPNTIRKRNAASKNLFYDCCKTMRLNPEKYIIQEQDNQKKEGTDVLRETTNSNNVNELNDVHEILIEIKKLQEAIRTFHSSFSIQMGGINSSLRQITEDYQKTKDKVVFLWDGLVGEDKENKENKE